MEKYIIAFMILFYLLFLSVVWTNDKDKKNNAQFDKCFATYKSEGMPREMYNDFMRTCYERS